MEPCQIAQLDDKNQATTTLTFELSLIAIFPRCHYFLPAFVQMHKAYNGLPNI